MVLLLGATGNTQPDSYGGVELQAWRSSLFLSKAPNLQAFLAGVVQSDALFRPKDPNVRSFGLSHAEVVGVDTLRIHFDTDWFRTQWGAQDPARNAGKRNVDFEQIGGGSFLLATIYPTRNGVWQGQHVGIRPKLVSMTGQVPAGMGAPGNQGKDVYTAQLANVYDSKNHIVAIVPAGKRLGVFDKLWNGVILFKTPDNQRFHIKDRDGVVR